MMVFEFRVPEVTRGVEDCELDLLVVGRGNVLVHVEFLDAVRVRRRKARPHASHIPARNVIESAYLFATRSKRRNGWFECGCAGIRRERTRADQKYRKMEYITKKKKGERGS
jgi:hypothetical protein